MAPKRRKKRGPVPPVEARPVVYRVRYDADDTPVVERLSYHLGSAREGFRLYDERGGLVLHAAYRSRAMQAELGETPAEALRSQVEQLEGAARQVQGELERLGRRLAGVRATLSRLTGGEE